MLVGVEDPREKLLLKLGDSISQRFDRNQRGRVVELQRGMESKKKAPLFSFCEMSEREWQN